MRFNVPSSGDKFREIGEAVGLSDPEPESLIRELLDMQKGIGIPRLSSFDIDSHDFPGMAEESMGEYSNCNTNPRPVSIDDGIAIYESTAEGN
jgi:alcohol dehydrogenase class IV